MKKTKLIAVLLILCLLFTCLSCKQSSITFVESKIDISVDEKYQLLAIATPASEEITYGSRNENIAKVDNNGVVTGVSVGNTIIEASLKGGKVVAYCSVHVSQSVGSISGESSYSYIGSSYDYSDSSCFVQLISKKIKEFPLDYRGSDECAGYVGEGWIYYMKTDSSGHYEFNNVPVGEYRLIFKSYSGTPNITKSNFNESTLIEKTYGAELALLLKGRTPKELGLLVTDTRGYDIEITKDCELVKNASFSALY